MGRITIFTSGDLNSKRVINALEGRKLPYSLIDLEQHPERLHDLMALAHSTAVPQVFFNTRHIGGVKQTMEELVGWDFSATYKSARERYNEQIGNAPDPSNPKLALPPSNPAEDPQNPLIRMAARDATPSIELPDGTFTTFWDMVEKLKRTLPLGDVRTKGIAFKNAFTGKEAIKALSNSLVLSDAEAIEFATHLLKKKVIQACGVRQQTVVDAMAVNPLTSGERGFKNHENHVYRLQCHMAPDVLNSYKVWTDRSNHQIEVIVADLTDMLNDIIHACMDGDGTIDYNKASQSPSFAEFEEAICELQKADMCSLSEENARLAFSLNVHRLMMQYSFIKIGVPTCESERTHMLSHVKFNIGGLVFTFQDWVDGILRANSRPTYLSQTPFNMIDRRRKFALWKLDHRIHFAINSDSLMGSSCSLPFRLFAADRVQHQLDIAARVYCCDGKNVSLKSKSKEVKLSKMFSWYRADFAKKDLKLLLLISNYVEGSRLSSMKKVLADDDFRIKWTEVNFTRNLSRFTTYRKSSVVGEIGTVKVLMRRFKPPKIPDNEETRLATLKSLNLLDTLYEERFDRITRMVKSEFDVPLVFISLVDADRQWFKSVQWHCSLPTATETGRDVSFCGHAIHGDENDIFYIENALEDDRFADNPLVAGDLAVRFYAGAPLTVPSTNGEGPVNIGVLCVIDQKPRQMDEDQINKLRGYAAQVRDEILRRGGRHEEVTRRFL